jgi:hypothetical protein
MVVNMIHPVFMILVAWIKHIEADINSLLWKSTTPGSHECMLIAYEADAEVTFSSYKERQAHYAQMRRLGSTIVAIARKNVRLCEGGWKQ